MMIFRYILMTICMYWQVFFHPCLKRNNIVDKILSLSICRGYTINMATIVRMIQLSPTMKQGILTDWNIKEGDSVSVGDVLATVETDKASMELESYEDGIILKIIQESGSKIPVGAPIAIIGESKTEDIQNLIESTLLELKKLSDTSSSDISTEDTSSPNSSNISIENTSSSNISKENNVRKASPLAKKIAKESQISLDSIQGTGPSGRIVKKDILSFLNSGKNTARDHHKNDVIIPVTLMRQTIASRLVTSKNTIPHFYLTREINISKLSKMRKQIKSTLIDFSSNLYSSLDRTGVKELKFSLNTFFVKAVAMSLLKNPKINSSWDEKNQQIIQKKNIHIGIAVSLNDGLIVPVIKNADIKNLAEIDKEANHLIQKAQNNELTSQDFSDATFTISNLGMLGIDSFTAIINPPEAAILAVGKAKLQPKKISNKKKIKFQNMVSFTLSCDHRVVDGAVGAYFLETLSSYLETPSLIGIGL